MRFSSSEILPVAASTGFRAEMVEKVLQLLNLLTAFSVHPYLKGKWVLKGGTALNLFVLNFRQPLWDIQFADSHAIGDFQAKGIPLLDLHELAAGKLAALLSRGQARDLFDCQRILNMNGLDRERLRIAFVTYGGMNRKDWRTVSIEDVNFEPSELTRLLIPTLDTRSIQSQGESSEYGVWLLGECMKGLSAVLPFSDAEREFLFSPTAQGFELRADYHPVARPPVVQGLAQLSVGQD